jgi:hypothetical protein
VRSFDGMATRNFENAYDDRWFIPRMRRRLTPIVVSVLFVALALAYFFRWGPIVRHVPSSWIGPGDLGATTYPAAIALAHGHLGSIYQPGTGFLNFPGVLLPFVPLGALSGFFHDSGVVIGTHGHLVVHPRSFAFRQISNDNYLGPSLSHGKEIVYHPVAFIPLVIVAMLLSCPSLFASDVLAERLNVPFIRRAWLCSAEAALLWNVSVFWGHPEDALALALATYALVFAIDERFVGAGWLFGAAMAVQPLVVVIFPILLVVGGKKRALGVVLRSIAPAAALTAPPLIAGFHETVHALVTQPNYPDNPVNHQTPWTGLAPGRKGTGVNEPISSGPLRIEALALAIGVGAWSRRWSAEPEKLVWSVALALTLRIYCEPVLDDYYMWPALAVAVAVAAKGSRRSFMAAVGLALLITVTAQWHLGWALWWSMNVGGTTALLIVAWPRSNRSPSGRSVKDVETRIAMSKSEKQAASHEDHRERRRIKARCL